MARRRGALWARRWSAYAEIRGRLARPGGKVPMAPLDGEPEWVMLERQRRERGEE